MNGRRPRAAIVGAGLMGRWHADAVRRVGGAVAMVVDAARDRAEELAASCGARALASLDGGLDGVDVVHVCTPVHTHAQIAALALAAGRHVLVEKPLAATTEATEALLTSAASRKLLLCPVHQFPFQPGALSLAAALPTLGAIRHIDFTACSAGATVAGAADPDAIALDILPHPLSLLARLLPPALSSSWNACRTSPGEWRFTTEAAAVSVALVISMSGRPTVNALRVIADGGTAHLNLFHGYCVMESGAVSRKRKILQPFALAASTGLTAGRTLLQRAARRESAYPGLRTLVTRFYDAIQHGGDAPIPASETLAIARLIDSLRERA